MKDMESYADYKDRYEEVNEQYEKEKERLTKLYQLYEETDAEVKKLREENNYWQNWYNSNKDVFGKLFSSAPPGAITPETPTTPENPPEHIKKKPKKKLRLKK